MMMAPPRVILGDPVLWDRFLWLRRLAGTLMAELIRQLEQAPEAAALAR
jgi:hypothetical protein